MAQRPLDKSRITKYPGEPGYLLVVVDIVERSVTTYVLGFYVCFCNFRLYVLYSAFIESASRLIKITTFDQKQVMLY